MKTKLELLEKYTERLTNLKAERNELKMVITNNEDVIEYDYTTFPDNTMEKDLAALEYINADIESLEEAINALENE
jgi:hypothetical protein